MKLPNQPVVLCVLIVCLTLLIFTWLTRNSLCELRLKDGTREVSAVMDYESGKELKEGGGPPSFQNVGQQANGTFRKGFLRSGKPFFPFYRRLNPC